MPLFRKSKEEGLKPLSEREIQERLYGFFHQERSVSVSPPGKKIVTRSVDLRSVEVTPAGIMQSDLFRSETQTQSLVENEETSKPFEPRRSSFVPEKIDSDSRTEIGETKTEEEESEVTATSVKKAVRKPVRKSKKDKKRAEAIKKFSILFLEKTVAFVKLLFSWISRAFASFVLWLSESRGESRRVPAKFILVSLAVIGTGLIFFNVWSSHLKKGSVPLAVSAASNVQVVTKVIPVRSEALSKPQNTESTSAVPSKKYFSIQVCVAQSQEGAAGVVRKLKTGGLPAFYESGASKRGGKIYHIMLGKFETYQNARTQLEAFKKSKAMEPYQDSFIRNLTSHHNS